MRFRCVTGPLVSSPCHRRAVIDTTLGNLPAAMLSGDTTTDGDSVLVDASQDMFDTTLTGPVTSTQADVPTTETAPQPEQAPHLYTKTERLCV